MIQTYQLYADGASRGNPGLAGAGVVVFDPNGSAIYEIAQFLGDKLTNNVAEYSALVLGLEKLIAEKDIPASLEIYMDSELVIKQLKGEYKVKHPDMQILYKKIQALLKNFNHVSFNHVRREKNKHADQLSNDAIDLR